jgi:hypothetical protein
MTCNLGAFRSVFSVCNFYVGFEAFMPNECIKILSYDQPRKFGFEINVLETSSASIIEG